MVAAYGLSHATAMMQQRPVGSWQRALGFLYIDYDNTF